MANFAAGDAGGGSGGGGGGPAVSVRGLRVVRGGRPVVHGLDCDFPRGRITGLIGPSGCGKSTVMRSIAGVQRIAGGEVAVLGQPAGSPALRGRIGYSTQSPAVYQDLTVRENLAYFAAVQHVPAARIDQALDDVGLTPAAGQLAGQLSGGQLGRASLAAALLGRRELLILDEPTVGLDPVLRRDLWTLFRRLAAGGATLLVSSHVMDEAERCDELLLMRDGRAVARGTPGDLRRDTGADTVEEAFLRLVRESAAARP
jgi:ABC-2 type transport system ATP-binding protein